MKPISFFLAIATFLPYSQAYACSPPPSVQMTQQEKVAEQQRFDRDFVKRAYKSESIIKIRVLTSSGENISSSPVRITKVLRGKARTGMVIVLKTVGSSLCGAGRLRRGEAGIIILQSGDRKQYDGFLDARKMELLRDEGLIN